MNEKQPSDSTPSPPPYPQPTEPTLAQWLRARLDKCLPLDEWQRPSLMELLRKLEWEEPLDPHRKVMMRWESADGLSLTEPYPQEALYPYADRAMGCHPAISRWVENRRDCSMVPKTRRYNFSHRDADGVMVYKEVCDE